MVITLNNGSLTVSNEGNNIRFRATSRPIPDKSYHEVCITGLTSLVSHQFSTGYTIENPYIFVQFNLYQGGMYEGTDYTRVYKKVITLPIMYVGVCFDRTKNMITYYINGEKLIDIIINASLLNASAYVCPYGCRNCTITANFGATPFKYPIPEGYTSYDGNQSSVEYSYLINPLSLYGNNVSTHIQTKITADYALKILDKDNALLPDLDESEEIFSISYFDLSRLGVIFLGIVSIEDDIVLFKREIPVRVETAYRTKSIRTFYDYEGGYKNKNLVQQDKVISILA